MLSSVIRIFGTRCISVMKIIFFPLFFAVIVIFSDSDVLRDFLYAADQLGMTEGDHVFITMELFPSDWLGYYTKFERGMFDSHVCYKYLRFQTNVP